MSKRVWELGIKTGDRVQCTFAGATFYGMVHCWTEKGCSIRLAHPWQWKVFGVSEEHTWNVLNIEATTEEFEKGFWKAAPIG